MGFIFALLIADIMPGENAIKHDVGERGVANATLGLAIAQRLRFEIEKSLVRSSLRAMPWPEKNCTLSS